MNFVENPDLNDYFEINDGNKRLKNIFDNWGDFGELNWLYFVDFHFCLIGNFD